MAQKTGKKRWGRIILLAAIIVALFIGVAIVGGLLATRSVAQSGSAFMSALAAQSYDVAYAMGSDSFQAETASPSNLQQAIEQQGLVVSDFRVTSRSRDSGKGEIAGNVSFADDREGQFIVRLARIDGSWVVTGFSIQPNE